MRLTSGTLIMNDKVEIFSIGTELVSGLVLDTNSHWLAGEITLAGGDVRRVTALADDLQALKQELQAAVDRDARLIITTGGLGPTPDDLTVDAVAAVAGSRVHTPVEVLEDFARSREMSIEEVSTPPRIKMGSIPESATLYLNPVGWAPCFATEVNKSLIWSMPGPPREVEGCFTHHIYPAIQDMFSAQSARLRVYVDSFESETSPFMQRVMKEIPAAYLKAYVGQSRENGLPVDIVVRAEDGRDPNLLLEKTYALFCAVAGEAGKTVTLEPTAPLRD